MSGATYRITSEHFPGAAVGMEWMARVFDLSDDGLSVKTCYGATQYGAESNAREWIGEQSVKQPGRTFYVFDDGTDAPEPETHSVKA